MSANAEDFAPFPKVPRLFRDCTITEKIDGTNAQVQIWNAELEPVFGYFDSIQYDGIWYEIRAASRKRWITPEDDNHGFAAWVQDNASELVKLGPGRHFGEWWGSGINRGYDLPKGVKRFSLFNTKKWHTPWQMRDTGFPACCNVVPVLYEGPFNVQEITDTLDALREVGSVAYPGFDRPEGIVVYHHAANSMFKVTLEGDDRPKSVSLFEVVGRLEVAV